MMQAYYFVNEIVIHTNLFIDYNEKMSRKTIAEFYKQQINK